MQLFRDDHDRLASLPKQDKPYVLSIGLFDGMHKGHQHLLNEAKKYAKLIGAKQAVLTYENHPSEALHKGATPLICTIDHKIKLLEQMDVDLTICVPFSHSLSQMTSEQFLSDVTEHLPLSHLVLGYDTKFGKDRSGNQSEIERLAKKFGFKLNYIDPYRLDDEIISSRSIRNFIQNNELQQASKLLGRDYSIYGEVIRGHTHGRKLGFPTANLDVSKLSLPSFGVYVVRIQCEGKQFLGVANLGIAPTMRQDKKVLLEVHIFDCNEEFYGKKIEVFFCEYLRPERKFANSEELRHQIEKDIAQARSRHS